MTLEQFDRLVRQVEAKWGSQPAALRRQVMLWALLGYLGWLSGLAVTWGLAALFLVPALRLPLAEGAWLYLPGGVILIAGSWAVLRALRVPSVPPEGRVLERHEAPELLAELARLQTRLRAGRFHRVLLTADCNASVVPVPRLGVLGWPRQFLVLGLPLLDSLSPAEMRAVLAHELAHLSRRHGRLGHWLYRLRRSWERLLEPLAQPRPPGEVSLRPALRLFVRWFWPRFNARAFVFSRASEYEADALAAELAGTEPTAAALRRIALCGQYAAERFWPEVWLRTQEHAEPPAGIMTELRDRLATALTNEDAQRLLAQCLHTITTNADTHPCLTDRLRALGTLSPDPAHEASGLLPSGPTAAEAWFGASLAAVRQGVEQHWRRACGETWRQRHAKAGALQDRLRHLGAATPARAADADCLWDRARVLMELQGDVAAEPALREVLAVRPAHAAANFHLGRLLLQAGQAEGETFLERAMTEDEEAVPEAGALLHNHFRATGQATRLAELRARLDRHQAALEASHRERRTVSVTDPLLPHGISEAEWAHLQEVLTAEPDLFAADLARKQLTHFPNQRLFVLAVRARPRWRWWSDRAAEQRLVERLQQRALLPGRVLICTPSGPFRPLARKLARLPDAAVFPSRAVPATAGPGGRPVTSPSRKT